MFLDITPWALKIGFTEEMLALLLFIPVLATLINVSRYIFGLKTLGIYAPMTLSFAYIFTGIRFGLLVTTAVIAATLLSYAALRKVRMHYISRTSITYTIITVLIIAIISLNEVSPISLTSERHNISTLSPLGIVLIASLSDFFVKRYVKKSLDSALRALLETVIVAFIGWALLRSEDLTNLLLNYTVIVIVILFLINYFVGKFSGVRVREYLRFKKIVEHA